jgi:hypothetical protein
VLDLEKPLRDSKRLKEINDKVWSFGEKLTKSQELELKRDISEVARISVESNSKKIKEVANGYLERFKRHPNEELNSHAGVEFKPFEDYFKYQIGVLKNLHLQVVGRNYKVIPVEEVSKLTSLIDKMGELVEKSEFPGLRLLGREYMKAIFDTHSNEIVKTRAGEVLKKINKLV